MPVEQWKGAGLKGCHMPWKVLYVERVHCQAKATRILVSVAVT